ncbi:MAG: beta-ketoacyl synthase N-terminal-like domain-containing protein [Acidimicrobiales bacterium]
MSVATGSNPGGSVDSSRRSVFRSNIVGIGAVTGFGWGVKHLWDGFLLGESSVKRVTGLDGFVDGGEAYLSLVADEGDRRDGPSRFVRSARFAGREAVSDAIGRGWQPGPVVGLVHSIEAGDIESWSEFYRSGETRVRPKRWVNMLPSTVLSQFMKEHDFHGPTMSVSAMCATANAAMITATSWLASGVATDVVLLATDLSGIPQTLRAFSDLGPAVLNQPPLEACRPFQEGSRGFVGGEAAVAMVLSGRPSGTYASVLGGAMTMDAHNLVGVAPGHQQMTRCFQLAIEQAGVDPNEVLYVNAHAPGTGMCDTAEAEVMDELFPRARGIFSVKPLVGHCQSAAAAIETLATLYGFETGSIPAPRQVAPGHPKLIDGCTPLEPGITLKSSIGMGGYNTAVVLDPPAP